jgi:23S rRNA (uracil1939-C5)-methyltransferase
VRAITGSSIRRVCYVSCNPATFARDARILCDAGFVLDTLWPVGQFRWSTHVELVSLFVRQP